METKIVLNQNSELYRRGNHNVGAAMWHLQWCTKYRYKIFRKDDLKISCEVAIRECCERHNIKVIVLNVQPDHVHVVSELPRGMTDVKALQLLKGFTSFLLFRLRPNLRLRYPNGHLWSHGSFSTTVGYAELDTVLNYVRNQ
jgi:putative transposase